MLVIWGYHYPDSKLQLVRIALDIDR
jgi:hypothetical protein